MTIEHDDNTADLERSLTALTAGPDTDVRTGGLWLKALEQAAPAAAARPVSAWKRKVPTVWMAAASLVLMVVLVGTMMPAMSKSRSSAARSSYEESSGVEPKGSVASAPPGVSEPSETSRARLFDRDVAYRNSGANNEGYEWRKSPALMPGSDQSPVSSTTPNGPSNRFVVRKSSLDLTAADVRTAFAKAGLVINEALGEYIESSSLTGEGPTVQATIALRVASSRLSEALNALRPLGTVTSEATTGQDVTDTVVDLDARIRNEQRIEKELLALIDKRPDAPLKDLMEIRSQLSTVRAQIESLVGQRERVGRLVSLATVLVSIRPPAEPAKAVPTPAPDKPAGIGDYFKSSVHEAWQTALQALVDTAAFLIRTIVGGIVWWIAAAVAFIVAIKAYRRTLAQGAAEQAPVG
jgi:hypothetical protein